MAPDSELDAVAVDAAGEDVVDRDVVDRAVVVRVVVDRVVVPMDDFDVAEMKMFHLMQYSDMRVH